MRKNQAKKRDVLPDALYNSKVVTKLINKLMIDGKKGVAQKIVYNAFDIIKEKTNTEPMEVFDKALRWIIKYAREGHGNGMSEKLAAEIINASNGTGAAVKKREDTHKMAEANKAFAHYRW